MAQLRHATSSDRAVIQLLVDQAIAATGYGDAPSYFLRLAFDGRDAESRIMVAEHDGEVIGCVLFGEVAGAMGTARIHFVAVTTSVRACGVGSALCDSAVAELTEQGARSVVVELPDERAFTAGRALLARCGFEETAKIADYFRDGVGLLILQRVAQPEAH